MKKIIWWIIGIVIVVAIIIFATRSGSNNTGPIKIGFIGPLSGDAALYGVTEKNITDQVISKLNAEGGISGRQIQMIYEDGKCNGKDATTAAQKLISIDKVKVILGGACSSETLAAAPIAEQNKVILFSDFSSSPAITNSGDYIFRNAPSDTVLAKLDAEAIIAGGFKKVAIISENNSYGQGVRKVMDGIFTEKGVNVVFDQYYQTGSTDFRDILVKLKQSDADLVYVNPGDNGKSGALIIKQYKQAGGTATIHGNFSLGTADSLAIGGKYLEGLVLSDSAKLTNALNDLIAQYQQNTGTKPGNNFELGAAYDRINIIISALKSVGYDADKIKNYLYGIKNYTGALGTIGFDQNGDVTGGSFFTEFIIKDQVEVPFVQ